MNSGPYKFIGKAPAKHNLKHSILHHHQILVEVNFQGLLENLAHVHENNEELTFHIIKSGVVQDATHTSLSEMLSKHANNFFLDILSDTTDPIELIPFALRHHDGF